MPVEHERTAAAVSASGVTRFAAAPPRRFLLPAILLLLSEQPGHGYELVARLRELCFGHVDHPAVYRALAQLEADGMVAASAETVAGQARRVHRLTASGDEALRVWMGVIKQEHDALSNVLKRYQDTGTTSALLAEVEGGWGSSLGRGLASGASTSIGRRRLASMATAAGDTATGVTATGRSARPTASRRRYRLIAGRSVVLIEVRSTVGPLSFGAIGASGWVETVVEDGALRPDATTRAHLEIDLRGLRSGNRLHDAELLRRIEARRYPSAVVELTDCRPYGAALRYQLNGELTFHGVTRPAQGTVSAHLAGERLVVAGEQVFDIRDFALPAPTVLMLRIYPDVRVRLHAEAELDAEPDASTQDPGAPAQGADAPGQGADAPALGAHVSEQQPDASEQQAEEES